MDFNAEQNTLKQLIGSSIEIAKKAGQAILSIYLGKVDFKVEIKADLTPVTLADIAAHDVIVSALKTVTPDIPILSEEDVEISFAKRKLWKTYWLIDPLDGTKEFINHNGEFTVNIALIHEGCSILGVIYAPVLDVCYYAYQRAGAFKQIMNQAATKIHTVKVDEKNLRVTLSRRHSLEAVADFIQKIPEPVKIPKGSSLKSCLVAEGAADIYPCFGKTSEWDMGAAQCVIEEAGGAMLDLNFKPIRFNQKESLLNPPLLVIGDGVYNWKQYL